MEIFASLWTFLSVTIYGNIVFFFFSILEKFVTVDTALFISFFSINFVTILYLFTKLITRECFLCQISNLTIYIPILIFTFFQILAATGGSEIDKVLTPESFKGSFIFFCLSIFSILSLANRIFVIEKANDRSYRKRNKYRRKKH